MLRASFVNLVHIAGTQNMLRLISQKYTVPVLTLGSNESTKGHLHPVSVANRLPLMHRACMCVLQISGHPTGMLEFPSAVLSAACPPHGWEHIVYWYRRR